MQDPATADRASKKTPKPSSTTARTMATTPNPPTPPRPPEDANDEQASRVVALSEKLLGHLTDRRIAILGLAFKKDTDDIREAASVRVIDRLRKKGAHVVAYDPAAVPNAKKLLANSIEFAEDPYSALKGADCCIVMTEGDGFRRLKDKEYQTQMRLPNAVAARKL